MSWHASKRQKNEVWKWSASNSEYKVLLFLFYFEKKKTCWRTHANAFGCSNVLLYPLHKLPNDGLLRFPESTLVYDLGRAMANKEMPFLSLKQHVKVAWHILSGLLSIWNLAPAPQTINHGPSAGPQTWPSAVLMHPGLLCCSWFPNFHHDVSQENNDPKFRHECERNKFHTSSTPALLKPFSHCVYTHTFYSSYSVLFSLQLYKAWWDKRTIRWNGTYVMSTRNSPTGSSKRPVCIIFTKTVHKHTCEMNRQCNYGDGRNAALTSSRDNHVNTRSHRILSCFGEYNHPAPTLLISNNFKLMQIQHLLTLLCLLVQPISHPLEFTPFLTWLGTNDCCLLSIPCVVPLLEQTAVFLVQYNPDRCLRSPIPFCLSFLKTIWRNWPFTNADP